MLAYLEADTRYETGPHFYIGTIVGFIIKGLGHDVGTIGAGFRVIPPGDHQVENRAAEKTQTTSGAGTYIKG